MNVIIMGYRVLSCLSQARLLLGGLLLLTLLLGDVFTGVALELDARLDQEGVVCHHLAKVVLMERVLNVVANVVKTARSYISSRSFQLVSALFHSVPVFLVHSLCNQAHAHAERHSFESREHSDEEFVRAKVLHWSDVVYGVCNVQVDQSDNQLLWLVTLLVM